MEDKIYDVLYQYWQYLNAYHIKWISDFRQKQEEEFELQLLQIRGLNQFFYHIKKYPPRVHLFQYNLQNHLDSFFDENRFNRHSGPDEPELYKRFKMGFEIFLAGYKHVDLMKGGKFGEKRNPRNEIGIHESEILEITNFLGALLVTGDLDVNEYMVEYDVDYMSRLYFDILGHVNKVDGLIDRIKKTNYDEIYLADSSILTYEQKRYVFENIIYTQLYENLKNKKYSNIRNSIETKLKNKWSYNYSGTISERIYNSIQDKLKAHGRLKDTPILLDGFGLNTASMCEYEENKKKLNVDEIIDDILKDLPIGSKYRTRIEKNRIDLKKEFYDLLDANPKSIEIKVRNIFFPGSQDNFRQIRKRYLPKKP